MLGNSVIPLVHSALFCGCSVQSKLCGSPPLSGGGNDQSAGNSVEPTGFPFPPDVIPGEKVGLERSLAESQGSQTPEAADAISGHVPTHRKPATRCLPKGRLPAGTPWPCHWRTRGRVTPDTPKVRLWGNRFALQGFAQGELTKSLPGPASLGPALDRPRLRWADQVGGFY